MNNLVQLFDDSHAIIEVRRSHETSNFISSDSGGCSLFIIGALAYAFKGDFFYNHLAVVFAPIAGVLRFGTAYTTEIVLPRKAAEIAENVKQATIQNKESGELHRIFVLALILESSLDF